MPTLEIQKLSGYDEIAHLDFEVDPTLLTHEESGSIAHLNFEVNIENKVVSVAEQESDYEVRQRAARFIGSVATKHSTEVYQPTSQFNSLHEAVGAAYNGDTEARAMVRMNSKTDVIERTIKAGHVIEVDVDVNGRGLWQHGQNMKDVHANALKHGAQSKEMLARTRAEVTNYFRLEQDLQNGKLEGNSFVVFSCAPDDMSEEAMKHAGFFTDTMSCSIQVTTVKEGKLVTESAFVAGVKTPGGIRHDIEAVRTVARSFGVDLSHKSTTEILGSPLLIPNSIIENGVVDIVKRLDDAIDGGTQTVFFGQERKRKDYLAYKAECKEREATFDPKVEAITSELIRMFPQIQNEAHASRLLNEISGKHMIEQAVFDYSIDPRVFGLQSAEDIYRARRAMEAGEVEQGLGFIERAKENDQSSSCPGGVGDRTSEMESGKNCSFVSKECPKCKAKNVMTTVTPLSKTRKLVTGSCGCSQTYDKDL